MTPCLESQIARRARGHQSRKSSSTNPFDTRHSNYSNRSQGLSKSPRCAVLLGTIDWLRPQGGPNVKEQIVVGVGGMERQVQLTWAIAESRRWGAPLLIVHCYAERYQSELPDPSPNDVENAKSVLALAAEAADQSGVAFDTLLGDGFPGEVLVEASDGASNLVIGSSHR